MKTKTQASLAALALEELVGAPAHPAVDLTAAAAALNPAGAGETGVRPEVRAAAAMARASEARSRAARGALAPRLAIRFGAQYENPNSRYFPAEREWQPSWDASAVLSWDLDFGITAGGALAARAEARAARAGLEVAEQESALGLARARAVFDLGFGERAVAQERVRVAERAVALTTIALEAGRATAVDLLDRERDLALARSVEQRAAYELLVAAERLAVLGGRFGPEGE